MKTSLICVFAALCSSACSPDVTVLDGDDGVASDSGASGDTGSTSPSGGDSDPSHGTPCNYLHGVVEIPAWDGSDAAYAASLYSFELGSSDPALVKNDGDVLYYDDDLVVNTVVDDASFVVDLGDVSLSDVPETVDPATFPVGQFGEHDYVQAVLDHTFVIRTVDGDTSQWAAARVLGLSPGTSVTIEWIRSTDPDRMIVPTQCF